MFSSNWKKILFDQTFLILKFLRLIFGSTRWLSEDDYIYKFNNIAKNTVEGTKTWPWIRQLMEISIILGKWIYFLHGSKVRKVFE